MNGSFSKVAGGNIAPSRFVVLGSAGTVTQAGAGTNVWGIAQPSTRNISLAGLDDGYAAVSGDVVNVYGPGDDECLLEVAGTVTAGQYLKSDADGKGVAATSDKDKVGAVALEGGTSGKLIRVKPQRFDLAV